MSPDDSLFDLLDATSRDLPSLSAWLREQHVCVLADLARDALRSRRSMLSSVLRHE